MSDLARILKEAFPALSHASLAMIADHSRLKKYSRAEPLFFEGETGSCFFYLVEGTVKLYKTSPSGQDTVLKLQGPGNIFAEVILFEKDEYPVSAMATAPATVVRIPREHFLKLLDEPRFRNEFIATLMSKQRYLTDRIIYLTSFDVEERFFRFLIEHFGVRDEYAVGLSKKDVASAIGTIPETLSRLIDRLRNRGLLSWEGGVLKVDREYLEGFASEAAPF